MDPRNEQPRPMPGGLISRMRNFLFPSWEAEATRHALTKRYVWPDGVDDKSLMRFLAVAEREYAEQAASGERQAIKRDRLLTVSLTATTAVLGGAATWHLPWWVTLPGASIFLLNALYMALANLSISRPGCMCIESLKNNVSNDLVERGALMWLIDGHDAAARNAKAVAIVGARQVNVATFTVLIGTMVTAVLLILHVVQSPAT